MTAVYSYLGERVDSIPLLLSAHHMNLDRGTTWFKAYQCTLFIYTFSMAHYFPSCFFLCICMGFVELMWSVPGEGSIPRRLPVGLAAATPDLPGWGRGLE